jgi:hypothetical protein
MFPLPAQQKWLAQKQLQLQLRKMRMATKQAVPRNLRLCLGHKCLKDRQKSKVQVVGREMFLMK